MAEDMEGTRKKAEQEQSDFDIVCNAALAQAGVLDEVSRHPHAVLAPGQSFQAVTAFAEHNRAEADAIRAAVNRMREDAP